MNRIDVLKKLKLLVKVFMILSPFFVCFLLIHSTVTNIGFECRSKQRENFGIVCQRIDSLLHFFPGYTENIAKITDKGRFSDEAKSQMSLNFTK